MARGKYSGVRADEPEDGDDLLEGVVDSGSGGTSAASGSLTLRQRLAILIAPKPPGYRPPRPAPRSPRPAPAQRATRGAVAVPEGKTIEDLINNLDTRERALSLAAAVLAFGYGIYVLIAFAHPSLGSKEDVNSLIVGGVIAGPALLLAVSVLFGRRALVGFAALLTGFAVLTFAGYFGFLYFALGIWLIMRAQRYARAAREAAGEVGPRGSPRAQRADAKAGGSKAASSTAPKPPPKSKRYTPPASATPSRRGRAPAR